MPSQPGEEWAINRIFEFLCENGDLSEESAESLSNKLIHRFEFDYPVGVPLRDSATNVEGWLHFWITPIVHSSEDDERGPMVLFQICMGVEIVSDTTVTDLKRLWNQIKEWRRRLDKFNTKTFGGIVPDPHREGRYFVFLKNRGKSFGEIAQIAERELSDYITWASRKPGGIDTWSSKHIMAQLAEAGMSDREAFAFVEGAFKNVMDNRNPFLESTVWNESNVRERIRYLERTKGWDK